MDDICGLFQHAIEADTNNKHQEALELYKQGLNKSLIIIKNTTSPEKKAKLRESLNQYLTRAEQLKIMLTTTTPAGRLLPPEFDHLVSTTKPTVRLDDVAGLDEVKTLLKEAVILPFKFPRIFFGTRAPWRGILLYGPPGVGKTMLAQAVAAEADVSFFSMNACQFQSRWFGDGERVIRLAFEVATANKPSIIFIDEIDTFCSSRSNCESESSRRFKTELLVQMDGLGHRMDGVIVLAASNAPWDIDSSFRRRIYVPILDVTSRIELIEMLCQKMHIQLSKEDFRHLAEMTEGFSGSDISVFIKSGLMEPIRQLQAATHFVRCSGVDPVNPEVIHDDFYEACSPAAVGAIEMTLMDIPPDRLKVPIAMMRDFVRVFPSFRSSIQREDLLRFVRFYDDYDGTD